MEQRKLISAVDYIDYISEKLRFSDDCEFAYSVRKFKDFLKQKPNIGDFVPAKLVNGVWIVLEEPNINYFKSEPFCTTGKCPAYFDELEEYNEAKNRVVFQGFVVSENNGNIIVTNGKNSILFSIRNFIKHIESNVRIETIEELVKYNLTLTEQKAKELGL